MFRAEVLKRLGGFDPQFFYHCEEVDLCYRVCKAGYSIVFTPRAEITHLGGQSVKRAPARFAIETYRSLYRYFYKHFGKNGVAAIRRPILITLLRQYALERLRRVVLSPWKMDQALESTVGVELKWNYLIKPMQFVETGEEPNLGYEPLAPGRPALAETGAGRALHGIRNN
jgi:GT2 family glycosyltransferase